MKAIEQFIVESTSADKFKESIASTKEKVKEISKGMMLKTINKVQAELSSDLASKGFGIELASLKVGSFRGHAYITSAKVEVRGKPEFKDENDSRLLTLLKYLQDVYSPKFKLKGVEGGVGKFNIR